MRGGVSMARHTARREGLDDYHASTTTRTGMHRLLARCGSLLVALHLRRWCCGSNQLAGACQRLDLGAAARPQAVMADAVKALGQYMKHEAADELGGRQRHGLVAGRPFDPIVLVAERDASLVGVDQPAVGRWRRGACSARGRPEPAVVRRTEAWRRRASGCDRAVR